MRCEPCRATGLVHCGDPMNCGGPWDTTEVAEETCCACQGDGTESDGTPCTYCNGGGRVTPNEKGNRPA